MKRALLGIATGAASEEHDSSRAESLHEELDHRGDARRAVAALRIDRMQRQRLGMVLPATAGPEGYLTEKAKGNVKFTVYPEAGHDSWTEAYNDPELYKWLLQQKRTPRKLDGSKK